MTDANLPILLLLMSSPAQACGPYFDHTHLSWQGRAMLDVPTTDFKLEMRRLAEETEADPLALPKRVRSAEADRMDLEALGLSEELVTQALSARAEERPLPEALPEEYQRYQSGVLALSAQDPAGAEAAWTGLLTLPPDQRARRGPWAAYMLGNIAEDPDEAAAWYQRTRALIAEGGQDSLGLYVASLRQESGAHSRAQRPVQALSLCLEYRASGARTFCQDLRPLAEAVLEQDELAPATQDPLVSQAIAALLTNPGSGVWTRLDIEAQTERWLLASEAQPELAASDRLAWAAYRSGDMATAQAWLERSESTAMAHWIQAKLHLQAGELALARGELQAGGALLPAAPERGHLLLSTHCEHDPRDPRRAIFVELGVVQVALGDYPGALQAFLEAGDWMDAAWVAERLLTTEELKAEVDLHWPTHKGQASSEGLLDGAPLAAAQVNPSMRHLLARRLAREGAWDQAIPYFPPELRAPATQVRDSLDKGQDPWRRDDVRGTHLWHAAYEMKQQGWALLATEMEPDFRVLEGFYQGADTLGNRLAPPATSPAAPPAFATQPAELAKLAQTRPPKELRYHFVWTSAELAEEAVALMDDSNPELPQALCTSGMWLRHRDPSYYQRAFSALATRAPSSALNGPGIYLEPANMGLCQPSPFASKRGCQSAPGGAWGIAGILLMLGRRGARRGAEP